PAAAKRMGHDQRPLIEYMRQTFPSRQGYVVRPHGSAKLPHNPLEFFKTWLIADWSLRPIQIQPVVMAIAMQSKNPIGLVLAHCVEEKHIVDQFGLSRVMILAGVTLLPIEEPGSNRRKKAADA